MIIVGLTGGIGSGKTTIAKMFETLGVPIYIADEEAKNLMNRSKVIKRKLTQAFGEVTYNDQGLNREYLAKIIFNDEKALQKINGIIHPKVAQHFNKWLSKQKAPYIIKEAAIIFENNLQDQYDYIITVIADKDKRIERIINRDNSTREKVLSIMKNQLSDDEKIELSDFIIENNDIKSAQKAVEELHSKLSESCA